jgi:hypothetical protein
MQRRVNISNLYQSLIVIINNKGIKLTNFSKKSLLQKNNNIILSNKVYTNKYNYQIINNNQWE